MIVAIRVEDLTKHYGGLCAVDRISFQVGKGSLFSLLGTNGAGKSTTIEILCTLLKPSSGEVTINAQKLGTLKENDLVRKSIGVVFQQSLLDPLLTVYENIMHRGRFYGLSKNQLKENYQFVENFLHLNDIAKKKYGELSGGQKRRADIARAIIHKPKILFLDEPTTGLDPQTRQFVWDAINQLREQTNMTIFLTTHYMEEAAQSDQIVIMKKGKIVASGTPFELKERYAQDELIVAFREQTHGEAILKRLNQRYVKQGDVYKIQLTSTLEAIALIGELKDELSSFEVMKGTLDHVFIRINEEWE